MTRFSRAAASCALLLACTEASAYQLSGHFLLEGGGYSSTAGQSQQVNITGLIGDRFNLTNQHDTNTIFGVGYLVDGPQNARFGVDYGINAFYLAKTKVSGTITQELVFTNLAYNYYVSHLPVYLVAKGRVNTNYNHLVVTVDAGVGPNFMNTNLYADTSLDGITLPDNAFAGNFSTTVFSAMVGIGLKFNGIEQFPIEIGYRYFYLGSGYFNPRTGEILNQLKTGNITAQAIILTVSA
jgi:opacity protein-like surface antigen